MKIVVISESEFSVKGHGVHTAFMETVNALSRVSGLQVSTNSFSHADVRHIHTVGPYSLWHLFFGSGRKVVSAHVLPESFVGSLIGAKYWKGIAAWYLRWFYNRADIVIAVSDETKAGLESMGVIKPIWVIYNMIDTSVYASSEAVKQEARSLLGIEKNARVVVGNGQVQPRKRIDSFIQAAKDLKEVEFIWVGGTPFKRAAADYDAMKSVIDNAPSNVRFTGVVELKEVRDYFRAADVFFLPSEQETFGLAIVEAAAAGLPIVLRDIHDYDHTFRGDALLSADPSFSDDINKILSDESLYKELQSGAQRIANRFDSRTVVKTLLNVYES